MRRDGTTPRCPSGLWSFRKHCIPLPTLRTEIVIQLILNIMEVKFEIGTINNAEGKGIVRKFIRLQQEKPMTDDELASAVEHECTLSRADSKAA